MQITFKERLIGYDIRYVDSDAHIINNLLHYPNIKQLKSRCKMAWHSRFRHPNITENNLLFPERNNFRQAPKSLDGKTLVRWGGYDEGHSYSYSNIQLWDNLGNMILRHPIQNGDSIVAFTLYNISEPKLTCNGFEYAELPESEIFNYFYIEAENDLVKKNLTQWNFLGYDVCMHKGYNFLLYGQDYSLGEPTIEETLSQNEGYKLGINRNSFGLLNDLETAVHECILMNAYHDDCPFFVFGVYEAIDINKLSFV